MGRKKTVLMVEGEPSIREALAQVLAAEGYLTVDTPDSRAAMERLGDSSLKADVMVVDLTKPTADWWEFRRRRKFDQKLNRIPLIALTVVGSTPRIDADLILHKPLDVSSLLRAISHFS